MSATVTRTAYQPHMDIVYIDPQVAEDAPYPTDVGANTLTEIRTAKVYAHGLSTLELASSGRVAVTADDAHALDITAPAGGPVAVRAAGGALVLGTATADVLEAVGATVRLAAASELNLSAGGHDTLTVLNDRIVVRGDIQIDGTVNSTQIQSLETLKVTDNFVELAGGLSVERRTGAGSQSGLRILTAPEAVTPGDAVDAYLGRFRDAQGSRVFHTDGAPDADKAVGSGAFEKGILFNVNGGSETAGARSEPSRAAEPFWDVCGGALRVSRVVPGAADGSTRASRIAVGLRVTDLGELELVQHRRWLNVVDGRYVDAEAEPARFLARFGQVDA